MTNPFDDVDAYVASLPEKTLDDRVADYVDRRCEQVYNTLLLEWAASDDGPIPTRDQARAIVTLDALTLIRALGEWADLDPHRMWPASDLQRTQQRRRGRRRSHDVDDDDG